MFTSQTTVPPASQTTVPPGFMDTILISVFMCILLAFTLRVFRIIISKPPQKLPPGPYPLPIIGNIHKLGKHPHKSLHSLAQLYGPIMCLKLGRVTTIVISSSSTAQHVLQTQDLAFSDRPVRDALRACDHYKYSVVFLSVGSRWRSLRKITSKSLLTANKLDANQHLRSRKVHELIGYCKKCSQTGEAVDIGRAAFLTSLNLLSNTIFSKDMIDPYQDSEEGKKFKELVWNLMVEGGKPNLVDYFPIFKGIDPQGINRRTTSNLDKLLKLFDNLITERLELKRSGNSSENSTTDMLDELLTILQSNEIDKTQIQHLFVDLFTAGTDTTSSTVEWAMAEILRNSETILVKAKAELNEVVGKGKIIEEADISRLPYLQCIVKETARLHPPAPFLIPHQVREEVQLCGYTIPKNSQVLVNAWTIGRDPLKWQNSLSFQPERFLDSKVDINGHDYELIPFGAGRRKCPGLPLAMRMVPVMLGSLLNCFNWKLEGGIAPEELDMEDKFGITLAKLQSLRAVPTLVVL